MTIGSLPASIFATCVGGDLFSFTCMATAAILAWRNYHPKGDFMTGLFAQLGAIFTPKVRLALYGVAAALLGVLVVYHLVDVAQIPAWLALAGAILGTAGTGTAAVNVAIQLRRHSDT